MEVIEDIGHVDAVVADPPYGIGYKPQKHGSAKSITTRNFGPKDQLIGDTGKLDFDPTPFLGLAEEQLWWGANYYADKLPNSKGWLVWFKARGCETTPFSHAEMAWTNKDRPIRALDFRWLGLIRDAHNTEKSVHPTQKPLTVMDWSLSFIDGETILDPYMGSGTTGVACVKQGRKFIGIEIDERYFDISCKRIKEAYEQPDLFIEALKQPTQESLL